MIRDPSLGNGVKCFLLVAVALLAVDALPIIPHARAATVNLWGRTTLPNGWGFTSTTVTNPGPTITTAPGGTVSLNLFSGDSNLHQFCVDYEVVGDLVCDTPGEPQSPFFSINSATPFSFAATTTPGNYTYFCTIHLDRMTGTLVVRAQHDVAVTSLTNSRNTAYNKTMFVNPVQVFVTATNPGNSTETFAVFAKANSTLIGNITITLGIAATRTITFNWTNTQTLNRGTYILTATATKVNGEAYLANNQIPGPNFSERLKGDVSGDCRVDIVDLATVGSTFGKTQGSPGFNSSADLNNDAKIDIVDLVLVASVFGQTC